MIDGEDVCRQQKIVVAVDKKLQERWPPTRDDSNRQYNLLTRGRHLPAPMRDDGNKRQ